MTYVVAAQWSYIGEKVIGAYSYYAYRLYPGADWKIWRRTNADESESGYCFGATDFATAWSDPTILTYEV